MLADDACIKGLPRRIKLGAYDWKVEIKEPEGEQALCGQTHFDVAELWLYPKHLTSPGHAVGVLLHECLHVVFDDRGLEHLKREKEAREEQIVAGFELGLIALFRDNPKFLTWFRKWLG